MKKTEIGLIKIKEKGINKKLMGVKIDSKFIDVEQGLPMLDLKDNEVEDKITQIYEHTNIKKLDIPKFSFDGNYLKDKGMQEGALIGKTLKLIEDEWLDNDFKISNKRVLEIIKAQNR